MSRMPTKKERLAAYRMGIKASAQKSREEMWKAGEKAAAIVTAMLMIAKADNKDPVALTDLIVPLKNHVFNFCYERDHYFDSLEVAERSDDDLQQRWDEQKVREKTGLPGLQLVRR